jgi:DNA primase
MPGVDFQAVRSQVSMAEVLSLLKFVPSQSSGMRQRGPCPIHGSRSLTSRSFSIDLERNAFQCFKCGCSGNQLDLWAAVTEASLHQAAVELCEKLHLDIPWIRQW